MRMLKANLLLLSLLLPGVCLYAQTESFRTTIDAVIEINTDLPPAHSATIGINNSIIIGIGQDIRFIRGIEIEMTAPQSWLPHRGALVMMIYNNLSIQTGFGVTDLTGSRIAFEPLPSRLRIIYHVPIRLQHGLRTTTSVTVPSPVVPPQAFPIMFRLMQIGKGLPDEFDKLTFNITARPILSDEGAVRLIPRYPPLLRNRPFTVLINDEVISNISEQIILREGEHHLVILSDDYRNESRRFFVERGRIIDLILELHDPTPFIIFEAPQNAQIYLNNTPIPNNREPIVIEPGSHEIKYQLGDYTVIRSISIQRGKTYRIALAVDLTIQEED